MCRGRSLTKPNILHFIPLISNQDSQDLISTMVISRFIVKEIIFMALHPRKVIEDSFNASNATKAHAEEFQRPTYGW